MQAVQQGRSITSVRGKLLDCRTRPRPQILPVRAQSSGERPPDVPASKFRVLAFEDSYNIKELLKQEHIVYGAFRQCWDTADAIEEIRKFEPDVLLLDYYIPPFTGLNVLKMVNREVKVGGLKRPRFIIGMSSVSSCNREMLAEGADDGFVKWDVPQWHGWGKGSG